MIDTDSFVDQHYQGFGDTGGKASLDLTRSKAVIKALASCIHVPGDVAECGVWRGGTSYLLAKFLQRYAPDKRLVLFDTFKGMPVSGLNDTHPKGDFADTSAEDVGQYLQWFRKLHLVVGVFPETFTWFRNWEFSFVLADMDQEQSTRDIIANFWPNMTPGGIMAFDDYYNDRCMGVRIAVNEILHSRSAGDGIQIAVKL